MHRVLAVGQWLDARERESGAGTGRERASAVTHVAVMRWAAEGEEPRVFDACPGGSGLQPSACAPRLPRHQPCWRPSGALICLAHSSPLLVSLPERQARMRGGCGVMPVSTLRCAVLPRALHHSSVRVVACVRAGRAWRLRVTECEVTECGVTRDVC